MANLVLIKQAKEHSGYTLHHIRYLIRNNLVRGEQVGRIWLVDLEDLKNYEAEMEEQGTAKFRPKSLDAPQEQR